MILQRTTAYCNRCRKDHAAAFLEKHGKVVARIECPEGEQETLISSNPEMFLKIRNRTHTSLNSDPPGDPRYILNYISITNACNFNCSVCGADAKLPEKATFLSKEEILRRAQTARSSGAKILHLIGGEPTLHPKLLDIVGDLRKMGFSTGLATNGFRLGKDPALARRLKTAGLRRICVQFDSMHCQTLQAYRRDALDEKKRAIDNAIKAGLNISLNCTVTDRNLAELGRMLRHGLTRGRRVVNLTFATAAPVGRFTLENSLPVCREQVIASLLEMGAAFDFCLDDFHPLPSFGPWRIAIHPDCGVHVPFVRTPEGVFPLNRIVDMGCFYGCLGTCSGKANWFNRNVLPALFLLRSMRRNKIADAFKIGWGLLFRRAGYSIVNVSTSDYRAAVFMDRKRLDRCATAFHSSVGPISGCVHFFSDRHVPGSRLSEIESGSC